MNILLYPYSWVSRGVGRVRDRLYRAGLFASKKAGIKVISVGNISLGGTGKTPLVMELVRFLQTEGYRPVFVTRGYKGRWEKHGGILTDGQRFYGSWQESGDEPFMVARNIPGVGVFVGRHRLRSCRLAKVRGFDTAVLDDGFQHRRLHRDLDIVLFDPQEKILRESETALGRARIILMPEEALPLQADALALRYPKARLFSYSVQAKGFFKVGGKQHPVSAADLKSDALLAFCGIARPERFFETLRRQGLRPEPALSFPDHHPYPEKTLTKIILKARQSQVPAAVTTEKDAVKLAGHSAFLKELPLYYLKIGLKLESGFFDQVRKILRTGESRG